MGLNQNNIRGRSPWINPGVLSNQSNNSLLKNKQKLHITSVCLRFLQVFLQLVFLQSA